MKKLAAITAMGLLLSFSTFSIASDYMALYTSQVATGIAKSNVDGGKIQTDLMSFYLTPKGTEETDAAWTGNKHQDGNSYMVFSVIVTSDKSS
jgi:hypothetical protein